MQDRYAGDVGDFLKIGLLRQLTQSTGVEPTLRLGVVWYLAPDEGHNADGKHVTYLDPTSRAGRELRPFDPDLYDRLTGVVESERSVAALEAAGVLPAETQTFSDRLSFVAVPGAGDARARYRADWVRRATAAVSDADLVFVDPDNGLRRSDHREPRTRPLAVKFTYYDELRPYLDRGQSVVAYHHADRTAKVPVQAQLRMDEAAEELGIQPLAVVKAFRGTTRFFLVIPTERHRNLLDERLVQLSHSPWCSELEVIRPQSADERPPSAELSGLTAPREAGVPIERPAIGAPVPLNEGSSAVQVPHPAERNSV